MNLDLSNRAGIVTGASVGIGRGIAKTLAMEKMRIAVVARRTKLLEELASEIESEGGVRPVIIDADLTSETGPAEIARHAEEALGVIEVLVNNAGASRPVEIGTTPDINQVWDESFALNFTAIRKLTDSVVPKMQQHGFGRVVNITGYMEPRHLNAAYSGKAATNVWAKGLSCLVAKDGVTINCIAPGIIRSEQIVERLMPDDEMRQKFITDNIPFGEIGEPEDIAAMVAFLCTPAARLVTGTLIPVDGGMHYYAG
jgi:3-oxoacyl-[acyl-carrier protein] reductase